MGVALALAAACATAAAPPEQEVGDRVDGGVDVTPPPLPDADTAAPDAGGGEACPTQPCDLHAQCGCSEGDACDLEFLDFEQNQFSDQLACRGVLTPGTERSACSSPSGCAAGYQCIGGQCRRYCESDAVCGGPGGACVFTRAGSERSDDRLCSKSCAPDFEADHRAACPSNFSCYVRFVGADDDRRGVTDCLPTGPVGVDGDCASESCGEGLVCITFTDGDGNQSSRCQRRCRVDDQTCHDGSACEGFGTPTLVGAIEYGFCRSG
jgi:hypothetical protein